ncbi:cadherin EGF LAG seven-pass G-type receptor 1-like isoform X1 [Callithrix jacchus]
MVSTLMYSEGAPLPRPLERPVLVEFALLETEERTKPVCVFWNHSLVVSGTGGRSARGCELLSRNWTHVTCQCSHTASFAVLMDVSRREVGILLWPLCPPSLPPSLPPPQTKSSTASALNKAHQPVKKHSRTGQSP